MNFLLIITFCLIVHNSSAVLHAEEIIDHDSSISNNYAFWGVSLAHVGILSASFAKQQQDYWSKPSSFSIMSLSMERDDALYADKAGHMSFAYGFSRIIKESYICAGMQPKHAQLLGSGIALLHQTIVEIQDGFSTGEPYLGFSRGDMIGNIIGAGLPVLQTYYPSLDIFRLKFSFNRSKDYSVDKYNSVLNDYTSTYHWLSINVHSLLSKDLQTSWTPYVAVAIGHSVKDIDRAGAGNHELWLSLDLNAEALPGDSDLAKMVKTTLQMIKLPMPCIRILPSVVWYGIRL